MYKDHFFVVFAFFKHKPRATFFIVGLNLTIAALMCNLFLTVGQGEGSKKIYIVTLLRSAGRSAYYFCSVGPHDPICSVVLYGP